MPTHGTGRQRTLTDTANNMAKEKQRPLDFRFYDMPQRDPLIVFYGEPWRRVYGEGAPNLHFHNVIEIGYCEQGEGVMKYEHEEAPYHSNMISVIPRNIPHNTVNKEGDTSLWTYLFIDVHAYLMRNFSDDPQFVTKTEERINICYSLTKEEECPEIAEAIHGIVREKKRRLPYSRELINSYALQILMGIARLNRDADRETMNEEHRHKEQQIRVVLDFIQEHFEEQLSIGDLAEVAHMSETHFRRLFKDNMNMAPADYLNMIRIKNACSMLLKTDYPIEIIAEKTGFTTLSTFNRNFKNFMDDTPLKWKKNHMNSDNGMGIRVSALKGWTDDVK